MYSETETTLCPNGEELELILECMEEVVDSESKEVRFLFGRKIAERYLNIMLKDILGVWDGDAGSLSVLFDVLKESHWFDDISVKDGGLDQTIAVGNSFEVKAEKESCGFLRGFFAELFSQLNEREYTCREQHMALRNICMFKISEE